VVRKGIAQRLMIAKQVPQGTCLGWTIRIRAIRG
jgi:hypothetical protein